MFQRVSALCFVVRGTYSMFQGISAAPSKGFSPHVSQITAAVSENFRNVFRGSQTMFPGVREAFPCSVLQGVLVTSFQGIPG